ncbi:PWWP domain-containing protein 2B isoform X1 [Fundulus heteroclitus]|uniref:PWWP domain-containing protein 2B isoform X1 n=2 Tax=Fundulus heteroclitus TaxID=8078 RepID=UPI00165B4405|nr:PWWP domain-containing protein 2B isoform X1 [Fundulus heteroclitus]
MEAADGELRAGSRVPVTIDHVVNDTLVVTLTYRERSYTGILLDSGKKTGLFCLPDFTAEHENQPVTKPACELPELLNEEPVSPGEAPPRPKDENSLPESGEPAAPPPCPVPTPVPAGQTPFPPYFEGAPFPQPLWVRHTYSQWVPQPPPRPMKRKKRRSREPGRMTISTIRLRPRQVLCEKCKNTLNSDEDSKDGIGNTKTSRKENTLQSDDDGDYKDGTGKLSRKEDLVAAKDAKRRENGPGVDAKRFRKDKRGEGVEKCPAGDVIPHSPVIKISYSTPQGKGEVMKIPSRVHGSIKPFCPKQLVQNGKRSADAAKEQRHILDATRSGLTVSIPKLKLTRPFATVSQGSSCPKIRLRPPQSQGEETMMEYEAELVGGGRRRSPRGPGSCLPHSEDSGEGKNSLELWSGSSGEEADRGHGDLTLLINFRKRKADSSSLSVCSSDSLDESKSFSSEGTSPETCDLAPGEDLSVTSSSATPRDCKTVPPLTVRLHTRSMTKCVTEEGHAVAVGDIVWGKIHGFPWWPARVLSISGTRKQESDGCEAQWPQAKVAWFGSPTTSQLSVAKLSPFRELFRSRFNRKKKGMYRRAILEAAKAVGHVGPEITSLLTHCDTG